MAEDTDTIQHVLDDMRRTGYSRIPVYHEDTDNVVASRHIKDLIELALSSRGTEPVSACLRDATFVPDTKDILPLLSEMQTAHEQMVVVVDEYGGTAGVITIEDIVEEIVGEIEDEFDPDNKYLTRLSRREWLVDGRFSCDDAVELGWPIEESDEYETIAGWILEVCDGVAEHRRDLRGRGLPLPRAVHARPAHLAHPRHRAGGAGRERCARRCRRGAGRAPMPRRRTGRRAARRAKSALRTTRSRG